MLKTEVVNLAPFQSAMAEKYPAAVKRGTGVGVKAVADTAATDLRTRIRSKSGKTVASIRSRLVNKLTSAYGYDRKVAWYARFVDLGTKPHPIYPKGRRGSKESVRVRRQFAKNEKGARLNPSGTTTPLRTRWDREHFEEQESLLGWRSITRGGRSGKRKIALTIYGRLFARVYHPGIKAHKTLRASLDAVKGQAPEILRAAIRVEIQKERR